MSTPPEENLENKKTGSLLKDSHVSPAKPWEQGEGGMHRALHPASHGAGKELADSSSSTTSAPLHPDRHMTTVERKERFLWREGEVGDSDGNDDKGGVGSSHRHWCPTCEHPTIILTCDGWKRHMEQHENLYTCLICEREGESPTRKYSRRVNLQRHLSTHGVSDDVASILAQKGRHMDIKKAYACGFCIQLFRTLLDQLNHIDQEHWRHNQDLSGWNFNKVIHGLLLQPNIQSSWLHLLGDTSSATHDFTWHPYEAYGLIRRLQLNKEPADDLAAAAIAQLTHAPLFPISGSYGKAKASVDRPRVEPFQRLADIMSDSSSDAESVESGVESVASSRTSVVSDKFSLLAADELVTCLLKNAELGVIYKAALESRHVGADRFERNFRRILNYYSRDLKKEARNRGQTSAAVLVRRRSRYIANTLRQELEGQERSYRHDHIPHGKDLSNLNILKVRDELLEELSSSDSNLSADDLDDKLPEFFHFQDFMFTSNAFIAFRATLWELVDHSLKPNLARLTAEMECCRAPPIDVSHEAIESISDRVKGVIEDFTRVSWDWWPLKPRMGNIPAGYARIRWYCVSTITFYIARANRPSLVTRSVTKTCQSFLQSRWLGLPPVPLMLHLSSMPSKELVKVRLLVMIRPVTLQHRLRHLTADNRANILVV